MQNPSEIFIERRTNRRFYLEARLLNADASLCAYILNIGLGGLAFRYVAETDWSADPVELAILSGENFYLANVPLITISEVAQHNGIHTIKRQGARFGDLTPEQIAHLKKIIINYAGS